MAANAPLVCFVAEEKRTQHILVIGHLWDELSILYLYCSDFHHPEELLLRM